MFAGGTGNKITIKFKFLLLILLLFVFPIYSQQTGTIQGKVIDKSSKQPIPFANVILVGTQYGTSTNQNGEFKITGVSVGRYIIQVSSVGYETITNSDVVVSTGQAVQFTFELSESIIEISDQVLVRGELFQKAPDQPVSFHSLGYEEVRRSPGAAGDLSRALLSFSSVLQSTDNRNDLLVRGGSPAENLYVIDNIFMPNINHFGTQGSGGGAIGLLNVNLIREVNFSAGGFPVKYGDKLSSVVEIKMREGNRENHHADINLSMSGFGAILEGPLTKKGSYLFSARRSYLDLIARLNATLVQQVSMIPNYSNFQGKVVYDLNTNNQISFVAAGGIDRVKFDENQYSFDLYYKEYKIVNNQDEHAAGINLRTLWSKNAYSILNISNTYNYFFTDLTHPGTNYTLYSNKSFEREYILKFDLNIKLTPSREISTGTGITFINFNHNLKYSGDTLFHFHNDQIDTIFVKPLNYSTTINTNKLYAYGQITQWIFDKLKIIGGLRWDRFSFIKNKDILSFRGALSYYLTPITTINFSYGTFYQTPPYLWLSADYTSRYLKHMKTIHYIFGFDHLFREDIKFTVELYKKVYSQIPTSKTSPSIIATNEGVAYGPFLLTNLTSNGKGYAQGLEINLQKKLLNKFYGIISLAHSKIRFTPEDGIERNGSFDYRNVFTFVFGYIPNEFYEFSLKWRFVGGRPYTPFEENLSKLLRKPVYDYARINAERFPPYHRLDIRFDRRFHFRKWNIVTYFELQNAYFRNNLYDIQWDPVENKKVAVYHWKFFPIGGINILF